MANEIKLVTASGQTVTPQDDALIYEKFATGSGIIYGCEVTIKNSNTLHINAGHGIVCGRKFTVTDSDIPVTLSSSGTLNGRLYIHLDLSLLSDPIVLNTEIANTLTPEVHGSNVNINNGIYDINLVTFTVDTLTIDNLTDVAPHVSRSVGDAIIGNTDISAIGDGTLTGIAKDLDDAMGSTDISAIGDGTATGAISALNADKVGEWTLVDSVSYTGTAGSSNSKTITMPSGWKDLLLLIVYSDLVFASSELHSGAVTGNKMYAYYTALDTAGSPTIALEASLNSTSLTMRHQYNKYGNSITVTAKLYYR